MKKDIMFIIRAYRDYNEVGMYVALFFCALIYLWHNDKNYELRMKFGYPTIFAIGLIINPVLIHFVWQKIFDYASIPRIFWIIPITIVISIAAVIMVENEKENRHKFIMFCILSVILILCGKFKYSNEYTGGSANIYDLPQEAIDIADYVVNRCDSPKMLVPLELATCLRVYNSNIRLLYGENATFGRIDQIEGTKEYEVYLQMIQEKPDIISANGIVQELKCDYIVFDNEFHKNYKQIESCGYHYACTYGKYDVYETDSINIRADLRVR